MQQMQDQTSAPGTPDQISAPLALPTIAIGGVAMADATEAQCVAHILGQIDHGQGGWVITVNLDILHRFQHDPRFAALCAPANLVVADGRPLLWVSRVQGTPLRGQVAGSNLVWNLSEAAAAAGRSLFLLGGAEGTAQAAAQQLRQRYPSIHIAGVYCPAPGFERDAAAMTRLQEAVYSARPDIIYVALGCPKQEMLIQRLRDRLPAAWWLGVGISFSYMCGQVRRAPPWMQHSGLEWLHRLCQEPRRLAHRYLVVGIPFFCKLFVSALWQGWRQGWRHSRSGDRSSYSSPA
jgi:N-acetylglucosaminyldiphosphoundecaprenol N-acetyl-beta-D-mannosaminyltransferase